MTPPVLLLHGQPGSALDFDAVVRAIGRRRFIAFDRPGWDGVRAATDIAGNGRAALAAMDVHGAEQAVVVGHSFGGAIAAWLGAHAPDRVAGLVLLAPSANPSSLYALDHLLAAPVVGETLSALTLGAAGLGLSIRRLRRLVGRDERYLQAVARRLRSPAAWRSFVVEQRALVSDLPQLEGELGRISAPTQILGGSRDRVVPASSLRELTGQIPGAKFVVVPGAGHLLPLQRPRDVAAAIEAIGS